MSISIHTRMTGVLEPFREGARGLAARVLSIRQEEAVHLALPTALPRWGSVAEKRMGV